MPTIIEQHLPEIKKLMRQHGVSKAYAFGSAIKNTMDENSDVDFIISFPENMDYETYGNNYFNLLYALQNLLNKDVELVTEKTLKNPYLLQSINQHKVQLL
ncbi:MAG: nucleotidyltransferase family protein [Chitinophagaceae bacterium]